MPVWVIERPVSVVPDVMERWQRAHPIRYSTAGGVGRRRGRRCFPTGRLADATLAAGGGRIAAADPALA